MQSGADGVTISKYGHGPDRLLYLNTGSKARSFYLSDASAALSRSRQPTAPLELGIARRLGQTREARRARAGNPFGFTGTRRTRAGCCMQGSITTIRNSVASIPRSVRRLCRPATFATPLSLRLQNPTVGMTPAGASLPRNAVKWMREKAEEGLSSGTRNSTQEESGRPALRQSSPSRRCITSAFQTGHSQRGGAWYQRAGVPNGRRRPSSTRALVNLGSSEPRSRNDCRRP